MTVAKLPFTKLPFTKLLVANRGEIAVRVIRTARQLGYDTVAVYSEADADALHVAEADEAVCIGAAAASASYLNIEALLDAAHRTDAQAVHPGYGFLSENAAFATACENAGLVFIGPPTAAIELMGSKRLSKIAMERAGVPTVPGYEGTDQTDARMAAEAERIGYPVMIKASAGGGGRGMRRVDRAADLADALARARSESRSAFGSDELILERAIVSPRHIEVQVFADAHGQVIHLGERECSIQRRHQKVLEEAPSPFVDEPLRQALGEAAVNAARACDYRGAGTVEFLVDDQGQFYFLEMNTRLQVEHPVTECITGQDLVAWQLAVASGAPLPLGQADIRLDGHAVEVRLYAEDPAQGYIPQTGILTAWTPRIGEGVRVDSGVREGARISPHYDPMLAKLIAWGRDRETARRRLLKTLRESLFAGLKTNQDFLAEILAHPAFIRGETTTDFLESAFRDARSLQPEQPAALLIALGAVLRYRQSGADAGWSNSLPSPTSLDLEACDRLFAVSILPLDDHSSAGRDYRVRWGDGQDLTITVLGDKDNELIFTADGVRRRCAYRQLSTSLHCQCQGQRLQIVDRTGAPPAVTTGDGDGEIVASMDGTVIAIAAQAGMPVTRGQVIVVLEAMKMEHPLRATIDGVVEAVHVETGAQVGQRQLLASISPNTTKGNGEPES